MKKRKNRKFGNAKIYITTVLAIVILASQVTAINIGDVSSGYYVPPFQEATYIIGQYNSTHYYAKNHTGYSPGGSGYEFLSDNASSVILNAWQASPSSGSWLHCIGTFNLSTYGLVFDITKYTTSLWLTGGGEENTVFLWYGTGYAINVTTSDAAVGHYNVKLKGFQVDGVSKTSGRNGIYITEVGRLVNIEDVYVRKCDYGITVESANTVYIRSCKSTGTNTGIFLNKTSPNGISITDSYIYGATDCGLNVTGGRVNTIDNIVIESCGVGVHLKSLGIAKKLSNLYVDGSTDYDIKLQGDNNAYPLYDVLIETSTFLSSSDHAIWTHYVRDVTVKTVYSESHTYGFLKTNGANDEIYLEHCTITDSIWHNGTGLLLIDYEKGTSYPTNATEGQQFYLTTNHTLWVYNSTHWVNVGEGAQGDQGPPGPAGNETYVMDWEYLVYQNSTAAYLYHGATGYQDMNTDHDTVMNWALGNLTAGRDWIEKVVFRGDFTIDDPIIVPSYSHILIEGKITRAASSNCNMFNNSLQGAGEYNLHVIIEGGYLDGNDGNNNAGSCIWWETHGQAGAGEKKFPIAFKDMVITNFDDDGIHIEDNGSIKYLIDIIHAIYCRDYSIYLSHCWDTWVYVDGWLSCGTASDDACIRMDNCGACHVEGGYMASGEHGLYMSDCINVLVADMIIDNMQGEAILLEGVEGCQFNHIQITCKDGSLPGDDQIDAVKLSSSGGTHCIDNNFLDFFIGRPWSNMRGSERFSRGIYEVDSNQDYNKYYCINARDCHAGVVINGANSVEV